MNMFIKLSGRYITGIYEHIWSIYRYDHPHILAGQGTMGLEIVEQVPDLDACIIPVGGGGLIAGAALAIKNLRPNVAIYVRS
jgi:threonine dehydratase